MSSMEKLESELAVKSSNIRNMKVDVADPSVLNKLKGELNVCGDLCRPILCSLALCDNGEIYDNSQ